MKKYNSKNSEKLYNRYCEDYEKRTKSYSRQFLSFDIKLFLENLPGKNILDLGSGAGRDSLIFKKKGFHPICLDISEGMLNLCRKKGLKTIKKDFKNLEFKRKFDGVWSYTSLTTVPKNLVKKVIKKVYKFLNKNGIFYLGVIEGDFDGFKKPNEKYDMWRYISRYSIQEILNLCRNFELIYFRKISSEKTGRNTYLNFMFKKFRTWGEG